MKSNTIKSRKYYLQLNGYYIIDFSENPLFTCMEDYLRLNIFTGMFEDYKALIHFLKLAGLISSNMKVYKISIVRKRAEDKGYTYITDNIPYKEYLPLLSSARLKDFVKLNKNNYPLMYEFISYYRDPIENKINHKEETIEYLKANNDSDKLQNETNSLVFFRKQLATIDMLLAALSRLINGEKITRHHYCEYLSNLDIFLENEIYYKRNNKISDNKLGIVKMAKFIVQLGRNKDLIFPNGELPNKRVISEFKSNIESLKIDSSYGQTKVCNEKEYDDDNNDPDSYMFIEIEDYSKLHEEFESEDITESIEVDIENLEEKQKKHKL